MNAMQHIPGPARRSFVKPTAWDVFVLAALLTLGTTSALHAGADAPSAQPPSVSGAETTTNVTDEQGGYIGVVLPGEVADLAAEYPGQVVETLVRLGDPVTKDQTLVRITSQKLEQQISAARASLRESRALASQAQRSLEETERQLEIRKRTEAAFPKDEIEVWESKRAMAESSLEAARARVQGEDARLSELLTAEASLSVRSPFDGRVASVSTSVGSFVEAGEPVVRVVGSKEPRVRFAVPAQEIEWLTLGHPIRIRFGDRDALTLTSQVDQIAPEIDPAIEMIFAEAPISPPTASYGRPWIGATVRVSPLRSMPQGSAVTEPPSPAPPRP